MTVIASIAIGGTNSYATPPAGVQSRIDELIYPGIMNPGDYAVTAQGSPNMTVAVASGSAILSATPTSESARLFRADHSQSDNVTIAANSSGSTKFDLVYLLLPAAGLHTPASSGDLTAGSTLLTSRQATSGMSLSGAGITNGILLAEVSVANGASSIVTGNITDKRVRAANVSNMIYVETATPQGTFTTPTDLTTLTISFITDGTRRVRAKGFCHLSSSTVSDDVVLQILEGATTLQRGECKAGLTGTAEAVAIVEYIATPTAGIHTYKLNSFRDAGSGNITAQADANHKNWMSLEFI